MGHPCFVGPVRVYLVPQGAHVGHPAVTSDMRRRLVVQLGVGHVRHYINSICPSDDIEQAVFLCKFINTLSPSKFSSLYVGTVTELEVDNCSSCLPFGAYSRIGYICSIGTHVGYRGLSLYLRCLLSSTMSLHPSHCL